MLYYYSECCVIVLNHVLLYWTLWYYIACYVTLDDNNNKKTTKNKKLPSNRQSRQTLFKQMETISLSPEQSSILHRLISMKREAKRYPRWIRKYFHRNWIKDKSSRSQLIKSRVCQIFLYSVQRKACMPHMNNKQWNQICMFKRYTV